MKVLAVHPGPLMYTKIFLRLEPLGLELVAAAVRARRARGAADRPAGREPRDYPRLVDDVAAGRRRLLVQLPREHPRDHRPGQGGQGAAAATASIFVGGHSASFIAARDARARRGRDRLRAQGRGRGRHRRRCWRRSRPATGPRTRCPAPSPLTARGRRPASSHPRRPAAGARPAAAPPQVFHRRARPLRLDRVHPRLPVGLLVLQRLDLLRPQLPAGQPGARRRGAGASIREPGVFIVDDVAFIQAEHGIAIGEAIARRGIKKHTISRRAATCCCATRRCSASGRSSGSNTCSSASRRSTRRGSRSTASACRSGRNFEALEFARSLGIKVAINIIADPDWDRERFARDPRVVPGDAGDRQHQRQHALSRHRELADRGAPAARRATTGCSTSSTRCCRPELPLAEFYEELVTTQQVLNRKHLGWQRCQGRGRHRGPPLAARPDQLRARCL